MRKKGRRRRKHVKRAVDKKEIQSYNKSTKEGVVACKKITCSGCRQDVF